MKRNLFLFTIAGISVCIMGCSIPTSSVYSKIYSFTKEEKIKKGTFGFSRTTETVKDFREQEMYDEDIVALKDAVEKYISSHPLLDESAKSNLREMKVVGGENKEQVELLLGEADAKGRSGSGEIWIYSIQKLRAFTILLLPVYFPHESYRLYFDGDILAKIERHYLKQMIEQASGPGLLPK